jgi:hypothetical protein
LRRHGVSAVVFARAAPWSGDIERHLRERGWRTLSCGTYPIMVRGGMPGSAATALSGCAAQPVTGR